MSENNDISSSSKSLLPEDVITTINKDITESFGNDCLDLWANLNWNEITSVGASMLFDILKTTNASLKVIHLGDNQEINDECMKSLGEYIKSNKHIESIGLDYTSISDSGIEILAPYLDGNTTFKQLYLNSNKRITDKSKPLLMEMIESSCIEKMDIGGTSITQKNAIYTLSACNQIKNGSASLDVSQNNLNDDDLIKICDAMKKYGVDKLKEIRLSSNNITLRGASALLDTLKECNSVVSKLDLMENQLDDECMKQLGEYIQDNEYVEILSLGNNKITDKGVEILSEYLIGNTTLKQLILSENEGITDASVPYLVEMINKSCIVRINLYETSISEEKKQKIEEALSIPIDQREIPIKSNTKSAAKIQSASASARI